MIFITAFGSFSFLTQALTLRQYMQETLLDGPTINPVGTRQIRENFELFSAQFLQNLLTKLFYQKYNFFTYLPMYRNNHLRGEKI